jgi:hypothetical protein
MESKPRMALAAAGCILALNFGDAKANIITSAELITVSLSALPSNAFFGPVIDPTFFQDDYFGPDESFRVSLFDAENLLLESHIISSGPTERSAYGYPFSSLTTNTSYFVIDGVVGSFDLVNVYTAAYLPDGSFIDYVPEEFSVSAVPGPIAGAGLPGLIAGCGALLALWRRRRKIA